MFKYLEHTNIGDIMEILRLFPMLIDENINVDLEA
jgi:hypothetical protein